MKKILVMASVMMLGAMSLQAANNYTSAGTVINNSASLTYSAGGVDQTNGGNDPVTTTTPDSFVVDNKIDLTVAHSDHTIVPVVPGATSQFLTFTVTNTGNKVQDYSLTSTADDGNPFGETDNFDATNINIYVEDGTHAGYQAAEDTVTYIDELDPDTNATVYIVANIPAVQANGDVAEYTLTAQVAQGGASGTQGSDITGDTNGHGTGATNVADDPMTEQIVFADGDGNGATDGANDGKYADYDAYKVVTAVLDATKTSCVISDLVNGTSNPKRIPGAVIRYSIDVNNTGTAEATNVVLTDDVTQYGGTAANLEVRTGTCPAVANPCAAKTGTADPAGTTTGAGTNSVTLDYSTIAAGSHKCGYFEVTIQ